MTRIIAGQARSLRLSVPKSGTRPTSDRVREAVFSSLESMDAVEGARVLDLFAGSGALGLEAASRGAAEVVLVERDAGAVRILQQNSTAVRKLFPGASALPLEVVRSAVLTFLQGAAGEWDLVFIDPPYELSETELSHTLTAVSGLLSHNGVVVVERSSRSPEPSWPAGMALSREKQYGETTVWFASLDD